MRTRRVSVALGLMMVASLLGACTVGGGPALPDPVYEHGELWFEVFEAGNLIDSGGGEGEYLVHATQSQIIEVGQTTWYLHRATFTPGPGFVGEPGEYHVQYTIEAENSACYPIVCTSYTRIRASVTTPDGTVFDAVDPALIGPSGECQGFEATGVIVGEPDLTVDVRAAYPC